MDTDQGKEDEVLRRMLSTPKPHKPAEESSPKSLKMRLSESSAFAFPILARRPGFLTLRRYQPPMAKRLPAMPFRASSQRSKSLPLRAL